MEGLGQVKDTLLADDDTYHVIEKESPEAVDHEIAHNISTGSGSDLVSDLHALFLRFLTPIV